MTSNGFSLEFIGIRHRFLDLESNDNSVPTVGLLDLGTPPTPTLFDEVQKTNTVVEAVSAADEAHYQAKKQENELTTIQSSAPLIDENKSEVSMKHPMKEEISNYSLPNKRITTWENLDEVLKGDDDKESYGRNYSRNDYYDNNERGDVYNEDNIRMKTQYHTIFIQNLPHNITKHELEIIFNQSGLIK
ncbi:unnamed protein product, partial [Rotaria magnacalcarata]